MIVINDFPAPHETLADATVRQMELYTFEAGYVAGWRSVRGSEDDPPFVPPPPSPIVAGAYIIGFSRGVRDATGLTGRPRREPDSR